MNSIFRKQFECAVFLCGAVLIFAIFRLYFHPMWRDEVQPFLMALDSKGFGDFFLFSIKEGHPFLWYLIAWVCAQFTLNPEILKVVSLFFWGSSILLLFRSPLKKYEKILIAASFYMVFEYLAISRGYVLVIFLSFLYLTLNNRGFSRLSWITLGLLANSEIFGALISIFMFVIGIEKAFKDGKIKTESLWIAIYLIMLMFSIICMMSSSSVVANALFESPLGNLQRIVKLWAEMVIPLHPHFIGWLKHIDFSNVPTFWAGKPHDEPIRLWHYAVVAFLGIALFIDRSKFSKRELFVLLCPFLLITGFMYVYPTAQSQRHLGMLFVAVVLSLWILRGSNFQPKLLLILFILVVNSICGLITIPYQFKKFSYGMEAANYLKAQHADAKIAGYPGYSFQVISAYMEKPLYFLDCECEKRTFVLMGATYRPIKDVADLSARLNKFVKKMNKTAEKKAMLVLNIELTDVQSNKLLQDGLKMHLVKKFQGGEVWDEDAFIYLLEI
jgi:hypothetical protein